MHIVSMNWINIDSGNGLTYFCAKPLLDPKVTFIKQIIVTLCITQKSQLKKVHLKMLSGNKGPFSSLKELIVKICAPGK